METPTDWNAHHAQHAHHAHTSLEIKKIGTLKTIMIFMNAMILFPQIIHVIMTITIIAAIQGDHSTIILLQQLLCGLAEWVAFLPS